jgi:hypothetical protein
VSGQRVTKMWSRWLLCTCLLAAMACTRDWSVKQGSDSGLGDLDASTMDASDVPSDAESADADQETDAGDTQREDAGDAETDAAPAAEYALAQEGTGCAAELEQTLACEGHASSKSLKCQQGSWMLAQNCLASERCDSREGTEQGKCVTMPAACVDKAPGDACDGAVRVSCGPDLVTVVSKPCLSHAHCEAAGTVQCVCDLGYEGDGQTACANPDDCPAAACAGGSCVDGLDDFTCDCGEGYAGTGTKQCTKVNYCPKDACTPGGTCVDEQAWSCQCGAGFSGTGTQACTNIDDCPASACKPPGGICTDGIGSHTCACNPGFSGTSCQNDICTPNPCSNGGTCSRTGQLCSCPAGFSGSNCQIDACSPNPCQHGGVCSRTAQGASCNCSGTGYTGTSCQTDVNECASPNECTSDYPCAQTDPPGYMCQGQFAEWSMPDAVASSKVKPSYTASGFQVRDNVTGLSWEQYPDETLYTWSEAKAHCNDATLAGSSDWRLPTKIELESLVDDTRTSPTINPDAFPGAPGQAYWTSSTLVGGTDRAWLVTFLNATTFGADKTEGLRVRCVRGGRKPAGTPSSRYTINGAVSVTDTRTGLIWQRTVDSGTYTLADARNYCTSLGSGWRLPTKKELLTLANPVVALNATPPPIDGTAFPNTPADIYFRTSSPSASTADNSWVAHVGGLPLSVPNTNLLRVRCVQ